jgi:hypothetical protein
MQVHNAVLNDTELVQEDFQLHGDGSAFMTREDEMVLLSVSVEGLQRLPEKVNQLVDRGFHAIMVDMQGIPELANEDIQLFLKSKEILENWDGYLGLVRLQSGIKDFLDTCEVSAEFKSFETIDEAIAEQRQVISEKRVGEALAVESSSVDDALFESQDDSAAVVDLDESSEQVAAIFSGSNGTHPLTVKELIVQAEELPRLGWQVERVLESNAKYVTLRLHFNRRMTSDDVEILKSARDRMSSAGGQLVLAALQRDVSLWLRLRNLENEFLIFDDVDAAKTAHSNHLNQGADGGGAAVSDVTLEVVEFDQESAVVRAPGSLSGSKEQELLTIIEIGDWNLSGLTAEIRRLGSDEVTELVLEGHTTYKLAANGHDSLKKVIDMAMGVGVHLTFCLFSAENMAELKTHESKSNVTLCETLKEACFGCAHRNYKHKAFAEIEYGFNRMPLQSSGLADFARAQTEAIDRGSDGVKELQDQLSQRSNEIVRLRSENSSLKQLSSRSIDSATLDAVKDQLELAIREKNQAKSELAQLEGEVAEVKQRHQEDKQRLAELEGQQSAHSVTTKNETKSLRKQFEEAQSQQTSLQTELDSERTKSSRFEGRMNVVNETLQEEQKLVSELKLQVQALHEQGHGESSAGAIDLSQLPEDASELKELLRRSEEDKLRILAEAQVEIERLSREQEALREELESAGEMIERLGKELELS